MASGVRDGRCGRRRGAALVGLAAALTVPAVTGGGTAPAFGAPAIACMRVVGDPANVCHPTLGAALAASQPGGTIAADAGIFTTNFTFDKSITVRGAGPQNTFFDGGRLDRVVSVSAGVTVTLDGLTVRNGAAPDTGNGGGIDNNGTLTLNNVTVDGNTAAKGSGGGVYNAGTLTLTNGKVSNNFAYHGAGIANAAGASLTVSTSSVERNTAYDHPASAGGGILNAGVVALSSSTLDSNQAEYAGGAYSQSGGSLSGSGVTITNNFANPAYQVSAPVYGGAMHVAGGTVSLANSTVYGNAAYADPGTAVGGALYLAAGAVTLTTSTFYSNYSYDPAHPNFSSGGGLHVVSGTVALRATVLRDNGNCSGTVANITALGYTLSGDTSCSFPTNDPAKPGNQNNAAVFFVSGTFGPLAQNGGPTRTLALSGDGGSNVAVDRIPPGTVLSGVQICPPYGQSTTDQRGFVRPADAGTNCDVGAFEKGASLPVTPGGGGATGSPVSGALKLISPVRVVDTRPVSPTAGITTTGFTPAGAQIAAGQLAPGSTTRFKIAGQSFGAMAVPTDTTAVILNVTTVQNAAGGGFVTVFPGDQAAAPNASTVNPSTPIAANGTTVALGQGAGAQGTIAVTSVTDPRDVVIDLVGYWTASTPAPGTLGRLRLVSPVRVLDTRAAAQNGTGPLGVNADGSSVTAGPLLAGQPRRFALAGRSFGTYGSQVFFPADTTGVIAHVTTSQGIGTGGFVTLLPGDSPSAAPAGPVPTASTLNPQTPVAFNTSPVGIPSSGGAGVAGTFALYSSVPLDAIVDVVGYWSPGNLPGQPGVVDNPTLVTPTRVLDTRAAFGGPTGYNANGTSVVAGQLPAGATRTILLAGKSFGGGSLTIPADVKGVLANVTLVQANPGGGFVTVFPGDQATPPNASTVNPSTGTAASFWATGVAAAPSNPTGTLNVLSTGDPRDILVDIVGYFR